MPVLREKRTARLNVLV